MTGAHAIFVGVLLYVVVLAVGGFMNPRHGWTDREWNAWIWVFKGAILPAIIAGTLGVFVVIYIQLGNH